jgi:hypothetical protein
MQVSMVSNKEGRRSGSRVCGGLGGPCEPVWGSGSVDSIPGVRAHVSAPAPSIPHSPPLRSAGSARARERVRFRAHMHIYCCYWWCPLRAVPSPHLIGQLGGGGGWEGGERVGGRARGRERNRGRPGLSVCGGESTPLPAQA